MSNDRCEVKRGANKTLKSYTLFVISDSSLAELHSIFHSHHKTFTVFPEVVDSQQIGVIISLSKDIANKRIFFFS